MNKQVAPADLEELPKSLNLTHYSIHCTRRLSCALRICCFYRRDQGSRYLHRYLSGSQEKNHLLESVGCGTAFLDYNRDGDQDIYR